MNDVNVVKVFVGEFFSVKADIEQNEITRLSVLDSLGRFISDIYPDDDYDVGYYMSLFGKWNAWSDEYVADAIADEFSDITKVVKKPSPLYVMELITNYGADFINVIGDYILVVGG